MMGMDGDGWGWDETIACVCLSLLSPAFLGEGKGRKRDNYHDLTCLAGSGEFEWL